MEVQVKSTVRTVVCKVGIGMQGSNSLQILRLVVLAERVMRQPQPTAINLYGTRSEKKVLNTPQYNFNFYLDDYFRPEILFLSIQLRPRLQCTCTTPCNCQPLRVAVALCEVYYVKLLVSHSRHKVLLHCIDLCKVGSSICPRTTNTTSPTGKL